MSDYDARALRVARLVQERAQPEFAILFGSRARGDHDELTSDIDVMLVLAAEPGADAQRAPTGRRSRRRRRLMGGRCRFS